MSDAQSWVDEVEDTDDDDDENVGGSLFAEKFERLVDQGDVENITVSTLEERIGEIDDPDLLSEAHDQDTRTTAEDTYQGRIAELNSEDAEPSDEESEDEVEAEEAEESEGGSMLDDVDDDEESEEDNVESTNDDSDTAQDDADEDESEEVQSPSKDSEESSDAHSATSEGNSDLPDVDVSSIAPNAERRADRAGHETPRQLLVWGQEGTGKTHVAHSAPEPIAYIDLEGKADELADKFDKELYYWTPEDFDEAKKALDEALELLAAYHEKGVRGTIVVDSMTTLWEMVKVDYAKWAYQTDKLSEVNFQSQLEGSDDWSKIKARHNEEYRDRILESPYHVVFTSGAKEDYNAVMQGADGKPMTDDGERRNRYEVKDVVRLRVDDQGRTVADLHKSARTRYSFAGLPWAEWDDIYGAIDDISAAEQSDEAVDTSQWDFDVYEGQPIVEEGDGDE
jgi:hypothetical protein